MCYGPDNIVSGYQSAILRFVYHALRNEPFDVHKGTGRSWCWVEDAVKGLAELLKDSGASAEMYNIGNNEYVETEKLADMIIGMTNSKSKYNLIEQPDKMIAVKKASFKKIRERFGWSAKVSLPEGLSKVIEYQNKLV